MIEPVQGEGGFYAATPAFMQRLRALCDEHGIMLIADEVQSGAGRTGTLFAMEQMGVAPDLTTFAKSIAGGFPLAGVTGRAEVMDAVAPGGLGGTYAGNPIACVAALEVLKVFEQENLLQKANDLGQKLKDGLLAIAEKHPEISDVRGLGAMIAIELFENGDHDKPDAKLTAEIVARARDKGLILLSCGCITTYCASLSPSPLKMLRSVRVWRSSASVLLRRSSSTAPCRRRRFASCPAYGNPCRIRRSRSPAKRVNNN